MAVDIKQWAVPSSLKTELQEHYKASLARSMGSASGERCIQEFTFDNVAPDLTVERAFAFLDFVNHTFLGDRISGIGLETGSGPGTFSALLARYNRVELCYAVEACRPILDLIQVVALHILGEKNVHKVVGCEGDFNQLEVDDSSLDFIFDFFSLHHSADIRNTFQELWRTLKPGGFVLCFDKARSDHLTNEDIEALLDKEYPNDFKEKMGISPHAKHTRRMNGEHEYRLCEWREAFMDAGFSQFEHFNIAKTVSSNIVLERAKRAFAGLPPRFQARLSGFFRPFFREDITSSDHRVYSSLVNQFPKEISLMIAYK